MNKFTKEEFRVLKELAQSKLWAEDIFLKDKRGNKIPIGNYSEMVKILKGK